MHTDCRCFFVVVKYSKACLYIVYPESKEVSTSLNVPAGIRTLLLKEVCFKLPLANDTGNNKKRFITLQNLPNLI